MAKLVACLLATAALWVRIQIFLKNTNGRHTVSKGVANRLYSPPKNIQKRRSVQVDSHIVIYHRTLQRQNAENLKQIFPEKEYWGLSPNFHNHVSVSELYSPPMGLHFLLEEICGPILGICKSLTDT